ncbi:IS630 family transposase [bacterium]|nr:IS630 family transposase [bacterium]
MDESGFILTDYKVYGWYKKGSQPVKPFIFNNKQRTNLAGALSTRGFIVANQYDNINGETFASFIKDLVSQYPKLVLIMDNISTHFTKTLRNLYEHADIIVIRLPKYSPQLNPIEQYWKNIKQWLGTRPPLTIKGLKKALHEAIQDTSLWPKSYGY